VRSIASVFLLGVIACGEAEPPARDGGISIDAYLAPRDAGADATARDDAGPYVGTPCDVGGVPGSCERVDRCEGVSTPGHCPGPAEIQCCTARFDAGGPCDPEAMPAPNEGLEEAAGDAGCPDGMVAIDEFCIDRYEASLVLVDESGGAIGSFSPFHNPGTALVRAVSIEGAIPQGYITGRQAADACERAGKRLCTDAEWLRACRGPDEHVYPYGDTRDDGACNDARAVHPAVERFGTSADWIWSELGDACINQLPESLARTGAHAACRAAEGAFDMMGNLHEWTADPAGTFRGGFYVDTYRNGEGCLYATTAHDMGHWDYSTGFRCCY
jgi:formylglycine-generating enzyme